MIIKTIAASMALFLVVTGCATTGSIQPVKLTPEQEVILKKAGKQVSVILVRALAREAAKRLGERLSASEKAAAIGICNDALNIENDLGVYADMAIRKVNASDDPYLKQDVKDILELLDLGTDLLVAGVPADKEPFIRAAFLGFKQGLEMR